MIKECSTKYFGNYSYDEESIILLKVVFLALSTKMSFLLIQLDPNNENVLCLQSLKDTNLAFFTVNPFAFSEDYHPIPTDKELKSIGAKDMSDVVGLCHMLYDRRYLYKYRKFKMPYYCEHTQ